MKTSEITYQIHWCVIFVGITMYKKPMKVERARDRRRKVLHQADEGH
ncbi:hypothetical protein [Virgibacillus necropolis]|nr:hypothetical protein [Virgibacillus necropolis]